MTYLAHAGEVHQTQQETVAHEEQILAQQAAATDSWLIPVLVLVVLLAAVFGLRYHQSRK